MSSLLSDYYVRSAGTGHIFNDLVRALPFPQDDQHVDRLARLFLELNCLTSAYRDLWESIVEDRWDLDVLLRSSWERQLAQIEIDVLVALSLGISCDELCMIYRTQFPVMRRYDKENLFDAHGRLVPKEIAREDLKTKSEDSLSEAERTWVHPQSGVSYQFDYPFRTLDREEEFRRMFQRYLE